MSEEEISGLIALVFGLVCVFASWHSQKNYKKPPKGTWGVKAIRPTIEIKGIAYGYALGALCIAFGVDTLFLN